MPSQKRLEWLESVAVKGAVLPDGDVALVLDRETATAMLGIYEATASVLGGMASEGCENLGLSFNQVNDGSIYYVLSKLLRSDVEEGMGDPI